MEGVTSSISTGLAHLDRQLNGGLRPGWLTILAARPGMGKTALALNIAAHVAESRTALVLSLEMTKTELHDRLLSSLGRVPLHRVMNAPNDNEFWGSVTLATEKIAGMKLFIDDESALSLRDVAGKARAVKRKHGLELLIVDYLQLMRGDQIVANRNAEIEQISRGLKALAKELDITVVALSQLNRAVEQRASRIPQLSDLRDSGAIEQDADCVMFLHREEVSNPDCDASFRGFALARVAKFRHGRTGDVPLTYRGEYVSFENHAGTWPWATVTHPPRRKGFD
jgi:replicative DNA helicase